MRLLEDTLAEEILSGRIREGDTALIDVDESGQVKIQAQPRRELLPQAVE